MEVQAIPSQPFSLLRVDFRELYARHLCRHSQLGINVLHLAALFIIWYAVYGIVLRLTGSPWAPVGLGIAYLLSLSICLPFRVLVVTAGLVGLLVSAVLEIPTLPIWAYAIMIPVAYQLQNWSHKKFHIEHDMAEFNRKYTKGMARFVILLFLEVPMIMNFLMFDRKSWARSTSH